MPRYENTKIRKIKKEGSVEVVSKTTTLYDIIPESDNDTYVISQYGDRLDLLAYQYYGDTSLWWYIAKANNLTAMNVPAGKSLVTPASTEGAIGG